MDPQALMNLALLAGLTVAMAVTAWLGGWLLIGLEAACLVLWRCYRGRAA